MFLKLSVGCYREFLIILIRIEDFKKLTICCTYFTTSKNFDIHLRSQSLHRMSKIHFLSEIRQKIIKLY